MKSKKFPNQNKYETKTELKKKSPILPPNILSFRRKMLSGKCLLEKVIRTHVFSKLTKV